MANYTPPPLNLLDLDRVPPDLANKERDTKWYIPSLRSEISIERMSELYCHCWSCLFFCKTPTDCNLALKDP